MPRLLRTTALALVLLLLLAACGGTEPTAAPTDEGDVTAEPAARGDFPRTVAHHQGETEVPAAPERVVVLDTGELDSAIALGVVPVGAVRAPVESGFLDYLTEQTGDTELVGTIDEPDLEAIAALEPDLILSSTLRHEAFYDQLSQIAPTVITETVGVVWKDNLLVHAEALGYEDRARELLDAYESRADALGETLAADGELPEVSMVRFLPGSTRLYQKASFIGTILDDIGLRRPEAQDVEDFALEVSEEQVDLMDGDVIFHTHYGPVDETTAPAILDSPLWQSLDAVGAGEVHAVDDDHWMLGIGVGAAELVLDDLEATLLGEAATATGGEGSFPVEIDHAFGTTTIADAPERVVTWGWGSTDAAIALGVVPVAIPFEGYAGDDEGRLPWTTEAVEAAGSQQPAVLPQVSGDEIPLEAIAAADPDVILAHYSGITADDYALLSEIAPTVAYPDAPWTTPWREVIDVTGQALGRTAEAEAVLADIDAAVAEAAAAHPELDGLTVASVVDAAGTFYVYREADPRVAFLTDLGLEVDDSVSALASGESSFFYTLSYERLSELTSDVLVVYAEDAEAATAFLEESPTADMAQVREGRVAVVESAPLISSVSPPTALSVTWGLEEYLAELSEAACAAGAC